MSLAETSPAGSLDRETYRRLVRSRNLLAVIQLTLRASFHLACLVMAVRLAGEQRLALAVLVLAPHCAAWSFLGWAGLGHELFHRNVLSWRAANIVLFRFCSILTWSNYAFFELTHPIHHRHTLGPADIEANAKVRVTRFDALAMATVDLGGFLRRIRLLALNAVGVVPGGARLQALVPSGSRERRRVRNGARTVLVTQVFLVAGFLVASQPILILGVTLAPFCLSGFNRVLALLQHSGLTAGTPEARFEESTRTVRLGLVGSFFYANMNLHLAHHVWPAIPYYNLPEADRRLAAAGWHIHEVSGFAAGLRQLARARGGSGEMAS